jgi:hypothetical protein
MPPLLSSWVESGGARLGAIKKDVKPQGSNKDGAAAIHPDWQMVLKVARAAKS